MFAIRIKEKMPEGIARNDRAGRSVPYDHERLKGRWWRVYPVNGREVSALRMLEHRAEKFAPARGNGILVSDAALSKYELSAAAPIPEKLSAVE
jgi:hypothetical protein